MVIREAIAADEDAVWLVLEPILRAGATFAYPRDWTRNEAIGFWFSETHQVFVAEIDGVVLGSYYLKPNHLGGGSHVANAGFMTAPHARGRGVARQMCEHALIEAKRSGYLAMQFNFVVSTNLRAVELWLKFGFEILAHLPDAFLDPGQNFVDAYVMFRRL